MNARTALYLTLSAGGILAVVAVHRGGTSSVGCCGGHGHGRHGHERLTDRASAPDARSLRRHADVDLPDSSDGHTAPAGNALS